MFDPQLVIWMAVIGILCVGAFWGFVRKLKKTVIRLVTLLLSFGGAFIFVKIMGKSIGRYALSLLVPMLGESVSDILSRPEMAAAADALCEMVAAPILFVLSYFVLKIITWVPFAFICLLFGVKGPKCCGRLSGALVGALCGMIGVVVFVTPVFGYITVANSVVEQLSAQTQEQAPNVLEQMMETPVAKESYQYVGRHAFRLLTTVDFEGKKVNLQEETNAVVNIWKDASTLMGASFKEYGTEETQAIKHMVSSVGESKIVSGVVAHFLSDAAQSWLDGEQALGMSKPNMGEDVQGIADAFLTVFVDTNSETLVTDLGTFADSFAVLVEGNVFTMGTDSADFVNKLVSGGVVSKLYAVLDANPRMDPVKTAIRDAGVRVMMDSLGLPADLRTTHSDMLEDMADTLKNVTTADGRIDQAALTSSIQNVMNGYEVNVSAEASQLIAEAIVETLTPEEILSMTPAQIADKMAERFAASGQNAAS